MMCLRTKEPINFETPEQRKKNLINELAIAKAKDDLDAAAELSMELYEVYGWSGTPYYC